jgi:tRNA-specific 2-thiouridylase
MTASLIKKALGSMALPPSSASRVVVAMSGGVDSSVAAALLAHQGYDVLGITLQLYDQGVVAARKGACCAGQDIYDAKEVAEKIGFPHYVLDYESRFKQKVIDDFADSYLRGETPIPCIQCNQEVKFKDLLETAENLGAQALVTGHYVKRVVQGDIPELHKAKDPSKDQSYFLFGTTQEQLNFLRFPLGDLLKSETRELARFFDLPLSEKPDSQDICFVAGGSYAALVAQMRPESLVAGDIVHLSDGRVLGRHEGLIHFTVGQRRGLKIASKHPLFVVALDPQNNHVIVGPKEALGCKKLSLRGVNWLGKDESKQASVSHDLISCRVRVRSSQIEVPARLQLKHSQTAEVIFEEPEYGVALGQACVFYEGNRLLGGGWIQATDSAFQESTKGNLPAEAVG